MHVSSRWCVTAVFALGALSCSDPVAPPAQGAFIASISAPSPAQPEKACPIGGAFTFDVPEIREKDLRDAEGAIAAWNRVLEQDPRDRTALDALGRLYGQQKQGAQLYDLRDAAGFAAGHINGAKHLDPGQQSSAADTLKRFKDRLLLVYCEDGGLSTSLTRQLHASGFTKVFNLRGGLAKWRAEGLPLARG